jgi:LmbE family N-acetylglucosaminyl deacetylase
MGPLLVFGAHPDDIEFGCGGIVAAETRTRAVHLVVGSLGEAGSHGTPDQRRQEAEQAASILGATLGFVELGGDAHFQRSPHHALKLAEVIRQHRPATVLAPTPARNQHPDHAVLGELVRDATRLARYGGLKELQDRPHAIDQLLFYAITAEERAPILVDVSQSVDQWRSAMEAHGSQTAARQYVDLQLSRAHALGLSAGVDYAIGLYPNDPLLLDSLSQVQRSARRF